MEKDIRGWFHHQHSNRRPPDLNSNSPIAPFNLGQQNFVPTIMSPVINRVSADESLLALKIPYQETNQAKEPHGWFYGLPQFRQAFTPLFDTVSKEKIPTGQYDNCKEAIMPNLGSGNAQKRFLVFDQSGDQTTLIFSSGIGAPVHRPSSWTPKPLGGHVFNGEGLGNKGNINHHSGPTLTDEYDENHGIDSSSEMHEDTEELNALLFSDDDNDYSEDDEVTSTGHSPSTLTAYDKQDQFEEGEEEIASSAEPTKRRKLFGGGYDNAPSSLMDTATSIKPNKSVEHEEDDAESSCGDGKSHDLEEFDSFLGDNNRSRQEKIRETVSILRNIIPGGKGKDSTVVIDDAISYLRSLKRKAEALGLGTL